MFTYWPFVGLIAAAVMVTVLLLLKFGDRVCQLRLTTLHKSRTHAQADEFELAEEGGDGTMIDFNMQQGEPDYSSRYAPEEYAL